MLDGNEKLKAPRYKEYVSGEVLKERIEELKKILADPIYFAEKYFYIISLDGRKTIN